MTTLNDSEKAAFKAASIETLTKVTAPLLAAGALQTGLIHLVGRKLFPTVFTSFGRTLAVTFLVRLIANPPKPTPEMKKISENYDAMSKLAR